VELLQDSWLMPRPLDDFLKRWSWRNSRFVCAVSVFGRC
jgi:hypothetical protein